MSCNLSNILAVAVIFFVLRAEPASAFVHIAKSKPHLPVRLEQPTITFQWNGNTPHLTNKQEVFDGAFAESEDADLLAELLRAAMGKWNDVESSYLNFEFVVNAGAVADAEDEVYAIIVEEQDSLSVAAAALPMFDSQDPGDSVNKRDKRIIYDCDISVGSSSVDAKDLLRTLVHELGHCVGLGHAHSNYHSIMGYSNASDSAELGLDDKAGISFLYPAAGVDQNVKYLTTCGGIGSSGTGALVLLLMPVLVAFLRHLANTGVALRIRFISTAIIRISKGLSARIFERI